jgi:two-component system NtrC family sensor kinase
MDPREELAFLRFLNALEGRLAAVGEVERALRVGLRMAKEHFGADEAVIAVRGSEPGSARIACALPARAAFERAEFARLLYDLRPAIAEDVLLARLERRGGRLGVLLLRRRGRAYPKAAIRALNAAAAKLSAAIARIDRERIADVRARLDQKILAQIRPQDLFYQLLHGLRTLTRYDHSAAVLVHEDEPGALVLVAEQIAWRKGGSTRIGRTLALAPAAEALLETGEVFGFERDDAGRLVGWRGREVGALGELLERLEETRAERAGESPAPLREGALLCAPLATRDGLLGLLSIASVQPGSFGAYEAELVRRFLPQAAVALRNLQRAASLESEVVQAEKKHVLAGLARGVAHDVNNAFGAVLPLVQQMIADLEAGRAERATQLADLRQVETSLRTCRRIFGGMLAFARGVGTRRVGEGDLSRAIESTLAILEESLRRLGIRARAEVPPALPSVDGAQGDLEQLVLNLATNARDAMPSGGELGLAVTLEGSVLRLTVSDTGTGIAQADLERVQEPFFTTKRHGTGLGLSICGSIVRELRGELGLESQLGHGTRVVVTLPVSASEVRR